MNAIKKNIENQSVEDTPNALQTSVKNRKHILEGRSKKERIIFIGVFIFFFIYSLTLLYPFLYGFIASLKSPREFSRFPFSLPTEWLFSNYARAFSEIKVENSNLFNMLFNSLWLTGIGTFLSVLIPTMTAYVISKYNFPTKNLLYSIAVFILVVPTVGSLPATYKLANDLGMINSPLILLFYTGGFGFYFIIMYGFFKNVSWSYAEAAFVDGATDWQVFVKVMIPQALPAVASLCIIVSIGIWNDYFTPFLYMSKMPTISSGIFMFEQRMKYGSNMPLLFAAILMSLIPILAMFISFQDIIMNNTSAGGLKG